MLAGIPKETAPRERRVAATPDSVKRLLAMGFEVRVEPDVGTAAGYTDAAYAEAGAAMDPEALEAADLVLAVHMPAVGRLKRGSMLAGLLAPFGDDDGRAALAAAGVEAFAMELMPRITRAQTMDALSSQSNLAGYAAVVRAADLFGRAFPMMVTAAGTIAPARVLVLGAGVAGLQAIATARRLGAVVSAMDVRPAAREQVESLGASFIEVDHREPSLAEDEGGYAREMGEDYKREQADKLAETLARTNIVITTAQIPGRPAPRLLSAEMVREMAPGSVIIDIAVAQGGNCELSRADRIVEEQGVFIVGDSDLPSRVAQDASALYARNLVNFAELLVDKEQGALAPDYNDPIISATALNPKDASDG